MKKLLLFILFLCLGSKAFAQTGVGTTTPDPSAQLDITSTSRGLLPPRMTQDQRVGIKSPAAGLVVYQTDNAPGLFMHSGVTWERLNTSIKTTNLTGQVLPVPPTGDNWVFVGSTTSVTVAFGQTVMLTGSAVVGALTGNPEIAVGVCYKISGGQVKAINQSNYTEITLSPTKILYPVAGAITLSSPGTYTFGIGVRNNTSYSVNSNDWMNAVVQVYY